MIDANGWFSWMTKDPGPPERVYSGVNDLRGVVIHSAEGHTYHDIRNVLFGDRGSSWHFTNLKDGRCYQHYSVYARVWASGAGYPNLRCVAWENEGVVGEPFTEQQNDNNVQIIREIRALGKWPDTRRPLSPTDQAAQLWEHREMIRFGADPTACPSGRVPWDLYLSELGGDVFVRFNGRAAFWDGKEYARGDYEMRVDVDFPGVPSTAKAVEMDIRIDQTYIGRLVMKDGGGAFADELNRYKAQAIVKVIPAGGVVKFSVADKPVKFTNVGVVGYWT